MKRIKYLFILIISIFIMSSVNAEDIKEYDVYINESNVITVKDCITDETINDYNNILSYKDNKLTINEGIHVNYLNSKKGLTITSNNKKVYLNYIDIHFGYYNEYNETINIDKLYALPYTSNDEAKHNTYTSYNIIGCNVYVTDSNITFKKSDNIFSPTMYDKTHSFKNTTLNCEDCSVYSKAPNNIFENVTINAKSFDASGYSKIKIKDCTINTDTFINFSDVNIYNSTINDKGYFSSDKTINIYDSKINASSFNANSSISEFKNTKFKIEGIIGVLEQHYENCEIELNNELYDGQTGTTLKNTKVTIYKVNNDNPLGFNLNSLKAYDSEIYLETQFSLVAKDYEHIIDNTIIKSINTSGNKGLFETQGTLTINNSHIDFEGIFNFNKINLTNSYIKNTNNFEGEYIMRDWFKYPYSTASSFIVKNDLYINNSRIITESSGQVPAVAVYGNITFDSENKGFINKNRELMDIVTVTVDNTNFLYNPNNLTNPFNETFIKANTLSTTSLNNELSTYAETYGYYSITFKAINGLVNDKETTIERFLLGDNFEYPTNLKPNDGYQAGSWKQTGENEYTYTFKKIPENPETITGSILAILGIINILVYVLIKIKKYKKQYYKI